MPAERKRYQYGDFTSVEQVEAALVDAPPSIRAVLVYWEYCIMRLEANGETKSKYDLPPGMSRFIYDRPMLIWLRLLGYGIGLYGMWFRWNAFPASRTPNSTLIVGIMWVASLMVIAWDIMETVGRSGQARRRVWWAAEADRERRSRLLDEALKLELERA